MEEVIPHYGMRHKPESPTDDYAIPRDERKLAVVLSSVSKEYVLERGAHFYCCVGQFGRHLPITESHVDQYEAAIAEASANRPLTYKQLQTLAYTHKFSESVCSCCNYRQHLVCAHTFSRRVVSRSVVLSQCDNPENARLSQWQPVSQSRTASRSSDTVPSLYCPVCSIDCKNFNNLSVHLRGGAHKKREKKVVGLFHSCQFDLDGLSFQRVDTPQTSLRNGMHVVFLNETAQTLSLCEVVSDDTTDSVQLRHIHNGAIQSAVAAGRIFSWAVRAVESFGNLAPLDDSVDDASAPLDTDALLGRSDHSVSDPRRQLCNDLLRVLQCKRPSSKQLVSCLKKVHPPFRSTKPQDAQEAWNVFTESFFSLTALSGQTEARRAASPEEAWRMYSEMNPGGLYACFTGIMENRVACPSCPMRSSFYDTFSVLTLGMGDGEAPLSVKGLLRQHFTRAGSSEWMCPSCSKMVVANITWPIRKAPKCLVLHLKRWGDWHAKGNLKDERPVIYDEELSLRELGAEFTASSMKLIGAIVHRGNRRRALCCQSTSSVRMGGTK